MNSSTAVGDGLAAETRLRLVRSKLNGWVAVLAGLVVLLGTTAQVASADGVAAGTSPTVVRNTSTGEQTVFYVNS